MSTSAINGDRMLALAEAVCDETASDKDCVELNAILVADENARRRYLDFCHLHFTLELEMQTLRAVQKVHEQIDLEPELPVLDPSSIAGGTLVSPAEFRSPPVVGFLGGSIRTTLGYFSEGMPLAYLLATVIFGVGLLVGSRIHVSGPERVAVQLVPATNDTTTHGPQTEFVGRITGMVDCRFEKGSGFRVQGSDAGKAAEPVLGARVPLGRKYELASGLMEITYNTGAKAILQGPVTYEVESTSGGYLAIGKLTARLEKKAESGKRKAQSGLSTLRSPLFSVRTPTATVTDLGTEFGVEVQREGTSYVETFVGAVVVTPTVGDKSSGATQTVVAGKAVRVGANGMVAAASATATPFARGIRREDIDSYAKTVLADNPLAYWPLNEAPGARWIADHSRSHCSGRVVGAIGLAQCGPFPNERSRAIEFTGNGYIEINQSPNSDVANGFSFEVWAKCDGDEGPQCIITDRDTNGGYMLYARPELGAWEFSTRNGAATDMWDSVFRPGIQKQWTHLVGTFEPLGKKVGDSLVGVKRLYVNGDLAATEKQQLVPSQWSRMRIGAGATELPEAKYFFIGRLAEMAVYDHQLSAERVKTHWEASGLNTITRQPSSRKEATPQPTDR